jgi:Sulfite exporter TauE/SafE
MPGCQNLRILVHLQAMSVESLPLVQLGLIIVFGYTVFGLTGFGSSVTAMPLLVLLIPLRMAVPLMRVFDLVSGLLMGLKNRRFIDRHEALRLIPFMVAGMAIGVLALVHAPAPACTAIARCRCWRLCCSRARSAACISATGCTGGCRRSG